VVVAPGWGDGICRHCQVGNTHICPNVRWPGFGPVGGFAEFVPVPARYLIRVSDKLQFEQLAPLTDAGVTPYRGIKKLRDAGALGPDRVVGVFGIGGLGGYAVQYAKILGSGATVVAFARNLDKLAIAKDYGRTASSPSRVSLPLTSARNSARPRDDPTSTLSSTAPAPLR
jgi:alcohol dehydrogenase, propanol-preferring